MLSVTPHHLAACQEAAVVTWTLWIAVADTGREVGIWTHRLEVATDHAVETLMKIADHVADRGVETWMMDAAGDGIALVAGIPDILDSRGTDLALEISAEVQVEPRLVEDEEAAVTVVPPLHEVEDPHRCEAEDQEGPHL